MHRWEIGADRMHDYRMFQSHLASACGGIHGILGEVRDALLRSGVEIEQLLQPLGPSRSAVDAIIIHYDHRPKAPGTERTRT